MSRADTTRLMKWKANAVPSCAGTSALGKGSGVSPGEPGVRVARPQSSTRACRSSDGASPRARDSASAWSPVACSSMVCASTQNGHRFASDTPAATSSLSVRVPAPAISDSRISAQAGARSSGADARTTKVAARSIPKSSPSCR